MNLQVAGNLYAAEKHIKAAKVTEALPGEALALPSPSGRGNKFERLLDGLKAKRFHGGEGVKGNDHLH